MRKKNQNILGIIAIIGVITLGCLLIIAPKAIADYKANKASDNVSVINYCTMENLSQNSEISEFVAIQNSEKQDLSSSSQAVGEAKDVIDVADSMNEDISPTTSVFNEKTEQVFAYVDSELLPIFSGILTALMTILALAVPFVKTSSKLKATQTAYTTVYDANEKLMSLAKTFDSESAKKEVASNVINSVSKTFEKYDNLLAKLVANDEIVSAQVATLVEGAKLAWKEADGASLVLSKIPSATVLEKQALTIDFLKSYVAKELNIKREELDKVIDAELSI